MSSAGECVPPAAVMTSLQGQVSWNNEIATGDGLNMVHTDASSRHSSHRYRTEGRTVNETRFPGSDMCASESVEGNTLSVDTEKGTRSILSSNNAIMTKPNSPCSTPEQLLQISGSPKGLHVRANIRREQIVCRRKIPKHHSPASYSSDLPLQQISCIRSVKEDASVGISSTTGQLHHISSPARDSGVKTGLDLNNDRGNKITTSTSQQQLPYMSYTPLTKESDSVSIPHKSAVLLHGSGQTRAGVITGSESHIYISDGHTPTSESPHLNPFVVMKRLEKRNNKDKQRTGEKRGNVSVKVSSTTTGRPSRTMTYVAKVTLSSSSSSSSSSKRLRIGEIETVQTESNNNERTGEEDSSSGPDGHTIPVEPPISVQLLSDFNSRKSDTHMDVRTAEGKICDKRFTRQKQLDRHMQSHTREKPHACDICPAVYSLLRSLREHKRYRHGVGVRKCKECSRYYDIGDYDSHARQFHKEDIDKSKLYRCHVCDRGFYKKCKLEDHMLTHSDGETYLCSTCGRTFKTKLALHSHVGVHVQVECEICGKTYNKKCIRIHMNTHDSEKKIMCDICGKAFLGKRKLDYHMKSHSGERKYVCDICGKAFLLKQHLKTHMKSHSNERPNVCAACGYSFKLPHQLRYHMKRHPEAI